MQSGGLIGPRLFLPRRQRSERHLSPVFER